MKPTLLIVLILAVVGGGFYFFGSENETTTTNDTVAVREQSSISDQTLTQEPLYSEEDDEFVFDERPAYQIYPTADEALSALRKGAEDYDDLVLEQFSNLGPDCGWCAEFYPQVVSLMTSKELDEDTRSYFAEVLAISNRPENIKTLIDAIEQAGESPDADLYAEALELTLGDDNIVRVLAEHVESENEVLQEASVAAITNQGSILAVQTLYDHTVKTGDADGYYALGIGVGEVIPEREALPTLQEHALKRNQYSHLAVKSLLNYGSEGVRMVFDLLENSSDPEKDRALLVDAIDHVSYEDDIEAFARERAQNTNNPVAKEFAESIIAEFAATDEDFDMDDEMFDDYEDL